ncbi:MAG: 2-oxoglutarate dehydrogenase complex dihydrolipoyllysine-residue succinyltransferase, partial [Myxococcaceae bacterium]
MSVNLTVPPLGESITEAVVGKWHKKVGESVSADEPIVVLETDKVTVDVPAPQTGALAAINHPEGAKVKVGEILGTIQGGASGKPSASNPAGATAAAVPQTAATESTRGKLMTPVAQKVVEENGLDASRIQGSGAGGRVTKDDALKALGGRPASTVAPAARDTTQREERVRMTPLRKRVAERLLAAQSTAAILTTFNEVDMSEVIALRKTHGERFLAKHGVKLGFMSFFVKAAVEALRAFPQINAEIDGEDVIFKRYYDIGVAVSGSRGLVVPVVRDADKLTMAELEKQIGSLGERAKTDKLQLADLQGGTFTVSNGGIFGSMLSTPILNPPQTGILGMHNITERAVVKDGQIVARPMMYLALSYDHRLVDGREA